MFKLFRKRKKIDWELFTRISHTSRLMFTGHLIERRPNRYIRKSEENSGLTENLLSAPHKAA